MKLTTVREIYKNREEYMNQEVTVGGWFAASVVPRHLDLLFFMIEAILRDFRLYIMIQWQTLLRLVN